MKKLVLMAVLVLLGTENALAVSFTIGPTQTLWSAIGMLGIINGQPDGDIMAFAQELYLASDDLSEFDVILNLEITAYNTGPIAVWYDVFGQKMQTGGWSSYDKLNVSIPLTSNGYGKAYLDYPSVEIIPLWFLMNPGHMHFTMASLTISNYSVEGFPAVPEPSTMLLFGSGLLGLVGLNRLRCKP